VSIPEFTMRLFSLYVSISVLTMILEKKIVIDLQYCI